ncbi:MAG: ATP-binding protein [Oligoflexia bacterium]|nr:ATP-binding protein [Oligoflexia bacterium]
MIIKYLRTLDLRQEVFKKSIFLFGPRQTGKTFLLNELFKNSKKYNLLEADVFRRLSMNPENLRYELLHLKEQKMLPESTPVIIDEIQKIPELLDEVHNLIESEKIKFILTGSSARKLKRSGTNLLAGRAWTRYLFPLTSREITDFNLLRVLNYGSLPAIYQSDNPDEDLNSYIGTYLQEEIKAEGLVRKIDGFSRFVETAALTNAELVNFAGISSDCGVPASTVTEYYKILQDTMIGNLLEPYTKTKKRKAISTAKFYFFDVGVCNKLAGRSNIKFKTELFGKALEHFIFTELRAYMEYSRKILNNNLYYWRSASKMEVDFLINDETAIEVKATDNVTGRHLKGLKALSEDLKLKKKIVVCTETTPKKIGDITVLPVQMFLTRLWGGDIF